MSDLDQVIAANDIVEVIGSYFPLQRAASVYRALCPFHQERTASFTVDPATQRFDCAGCGASGDIANFVVRYENVDRPAALRKLAQRAGIQPDGGAVSASAAKLIAILARKFPLPSTSATEDELRQRAATAEGLLLALPVADNAGYTELRDEMLREVQRRAEEMILAAIELVSRSR